MIRSFRLFLIPLLLLAASLVQAQQRPAIRQLGAITARASQSFGPMFTIRALSNGSVLVNDFAGRRVLLFDSTLTSFQIVADSTSATANAYGGRTAGLVPFHGDSTLFIDPNSTSMIVIDASGKLGRVMSLPRSQDAWTLVGGTRGSTGFDPRGALIYRGVPELRMVSSSVAGGQLQLPGQSDSAAIVRVDLATRRLDTLAHFKVPRVNRTVTPRNDGSIEITSQVNPLPVVDEWAVLADGTLAIVRGSDYHVDYIAPDGTRRSAPKIPFDWQRLTDEDKVAFIDSVRVARERMQASGGSSPAAAGAPVVQMRVSGPGGASGGAAAGGAAAQQPQLSFVPPEELPDYKPAFLANSLRSDTEGNLWVLTVPTQVIPGGPVYDVINREGQLVERVQIPEGRTIIGFGPDVVYLAAREGDRSVIERASLR